jgi:hypothetical protein
LGDTRGAFAFDAVTLTLGCRIAIELAIPEVV